jgi:hypothetical protein
MAIWMAMETGREGIKMLRMEKDRLRCPITTLLKFLQHGTPLPQMRLRIMSSRKPLIAVSPWQNVQFAAMLKINLQLQASVGQLTNQVLAAQGQVAAANVLARQAQTAVHGAANVDRFRPAAPPKYGDKKKG